MKDKKVMLMEWTFYFANNPYLLCFVFCSCNVKCFRNNQQYFYVFNVFTLIIIAFLLCNYLHNFRNLKIKNEHVHIFWYLMFVCVISISMHVYIYLHVI